MITIKLDKTPNQQLTVQLDGVRYKIRIRALTIGMAVDVQINEEQVLTGHKCISELPLLPYKYQEKIGGNFMFLTEAGDIVDYTQFGKTQSLLYFTRGELGAIRGD